MTLPALLDCRAIMTELGVKRTVAEAIMRQLPKIRIPGVRKVFVRRAGVERYHCNPDGTGLWAYEEEVKEFRQYEREEESLRLGYVGERVLGAR